MKEYLRRNATSTLVAVAFLLVVVLTLSSRDMPGPGPGVGDAQAVRATAATSTPGAWKAFQKPDKETLRAALSSIQYSVTQEEGTETPYQNEYWDKKNVGIYVDVVSGEPLFSSTDKYDSGTGWPSFTKPLVPENITVRTDNFLGYERTEARSLHGDSHLGHVFNDGPAPFGLRYCMNSAALLFIPADDLVAEGYGEFSYLFEGISLTK